MPTPRDVLGDVQLVDVTLWEGMGKGKGGGRAQLSSASISASLVFASPGFSSRYKSYVIPGETLIGGGSVSPWYWICVISKQIEESCRLRCRKFLPPMKCDAKKLHPNKNLGRLMHSKLPHAEKRGNRSHSLKTNNRWYC